MNLSPQQLAAALGGETRGNEVLAPGPGHSPKDRSLSIRLDPHAPDGIVVNSFAGDDPLACKDYVRERAGLPRWEPRQRDASASIIRMQQRLSSQVGTKGRPAEYVYKLEDGSPYLRVKRTADKRFYQQHWTGTEWANGAPNGPKIPYRLLELLTQSVSVLIVEGEKDADRLADLGFVATTNAGGAEKWTADLNCHFEGKSVCILPDNDEPGERHAARVADNLLPVAKEVRLLRLPDLPPKGDVSDWLDTGGTLDGLKRLIAEAPAYQAPGAEPSNWPPQLKTIVDELARTRKGRIEALTAKVIEAAQIPGVTYAMLVAASNEACRRNGLTQSERPSAIQQAFEAGLSRAGISKPNQAQSQLRTQLETRAASFFKPKGIRWLWKDRFALGKLGLIGGMPDRGKGLITADLIACVTSNRPLPCKEGVPPQGSVIMFTAEDDLSDTVVPRLMAAGADLDRVHIVQCARESDGRQRTFSMVTDLESLRAKLEEIPNVVLVIIDPMSAYVGVGKVNNSMTTDVRGFLKPLTDLAAEKGVSVIGIMHFNKKADVGNAMLRIADSLAYVAAARHVYFVVDDPEVDKRRLFVEAKNNLAPDVKALSYMVGVRFVDTDEETKEEIRAPYIEWGQQHVEISASEAMQSESGGNKGRTERREAKEFLQSCLALGPLPQKEIIEDAEAAGITKATLDRAKKDLGVKSRKEKGLDKGWVWEMPRLAS